MHAVGDSVNSIPFETFRNERFWTDALRLQQGVMAAGPTPLQALRLGLMVESDMRLTQLWPRSWPNRRWTCHRRTHPP